MNTKIWIDDLRNPPDDTYDIARTYDQAITMLTNTNYTHACVDHDIGDYDDNGRERSGYDILVWLADRAQNGIPVPLTYTVLTANPSARPRMLGVIQRYLS